MRGASFDKKIGYYINYIIPAAGTEVNCTPDAASRLISFQKNPKSLSFQHGIFCS